MSAPYSASEPVRHPQFMAIPIHNMGLFSEDGINGCVHDVTFRNIQLLTDGEGLPKPKASFWGLDADHKVKRITVDGIFRDGKRLAWEDIEWINNEFAEDIRYH